MAAVSALCSRAVLLDNGRLVESGPTREVIDAYLMRGREASSTPLTERIDRSGKGSVRFTALGLEDGDGNAITTATSGRPVTVRLDYSSADGRPVHHVVVGIYVRGLYGQPLFICLSRVARNGFPSLAPSGSIRCHIPMLPLLPGVYVDCGQKVLGAGNLLRFDFIARDVHDVSIADRNHVVVVDLCVAVERHASTVGTGPEDDLGPLLFGFLPQLGKVQVKTRQDRDPTEIRVEDLDPFLAEI